MVKVVKVPVRPLKVRVISVTGGRKMVLSLQLPCSSCLDPPPGILLQMLKKEKSRAQEAAALFGHTCDEHSPAPHSPTPHNSTPYTSTPQKTARHSPTPQITAHHSPTPQITDPHSHGPDTPTHQILPSQNTSKTPTLPLLDAQMDKSPAPTTSTAADLEGASGQNLSTGRVSISQQAE